MVASREHTNSVTWNQGVEQTGLCSVGDLIIIRATVPHNGDFVRPSYCVHHAGFVETIRRTTEITR